MKKLLSLLSILTISGTALPTTIAASPYQKENINLENSYINHQQTNNLKIKKIQNNNIFQNIPKLKIINSKEGINFYFEKLVNNFIPFLLNNDITRIISYRTTTDILNNRIDNTYFLNYNNNDNQHFIMTINIENDREITLVFRRSDFYLQGFIGHPNSNQQTLNVYYHFNDATIIELPDQEITREEIIPFGSSYQGSNNLNANANAPIRWTGIVDAFQQLANYGENPKNVDLNTLRASFVRVILATAESMRFRTVRNNIISNYNNDSETSHWGWYFNNFLRNWSRFSQDALNYLIQFGTLIGYINLCDINIFSNLFLNNLQPCNKKQKRDLNNNEYCYINNDINNVIYDQQDYFKVKYCFLCHDDIKILLSEKTSKRIETIFYFHKKDDFKKYLINLFKKIKQLDETGAGGGIQESDYEVAADVVWKHFSDIKDKIDSISNAVSSHIVITTDRGSKWSVYLKNI